MADSMYYQWLKDGQPYALVRWMKELQAKIRARGYTVYDYPSVGHQKADPAEDHTAYSETGWPIKSPYGKGHAIDIMPKPGTDARALTSLARELIRAKDAGELPHLKYINWTDEAGVIWQTSWKPTKRTVRNSDAGHLHLSSRSDCGNAPLGAYDPWGKPPIAPEEIKKMGKQVIFKDDDKLWIGDGLQCHEITADQVDDYRVLTTAGVFDVWNGQFSGVSNGIWPDAGPGKHFFGVPIDTTPPASAEDIAAELLPELTAAVIEAMPDNVLTDEQAEEACARALRRVLVVVSPKADGDVLDGPSA